MAGQQNATSSDKKPTSDEKPLEKTKIDVTVTPKESKDRQTKQANKEYADKVKKSLEGDVKKAVDGAKDGGSKKQLDAAEKAATDAGKKIDPQKIEKVKVKVEGEAGGQKKTTEKVVTPTKEG